MPGPPLRIIIAPGCRSDEIGDERHLPAFEILGGEDSHARADLAGRSISARSRDDDALANRSDLELQAERFGCAWRFGRFEAGKRGDDAAVRGLGDGQLEAAAIVREHANRIAPGIDDSNQGARHWPAVLIHDRARRGTTLRQCRHCGEAECKDDENGSAGGKQPPRAEGVASVLLSASHAPMKDAPVRPGFLTRGSRRLSRLPGRLRPVTLWERR